MRETRANLADSFEQAIGACLNVATSSKPVFNAWKPNVPDDPSTWVAPGEAIRINEGWGSGVKSIAAGPRWYVRILPKNFDPTSLDNGAHAPPVHFGGFSSGQTTGGTLTYSGCVRADNPNDTLLGAAMWFRDTGEIWSMSLDERGTYDGISYSNGDGTVEHWATSLWYDLNTLASNGGIAPFKVRIGVTGLDGTHWNDVYSMGHKPPIALEQSFENEFEITGIGLDDWKSKFVDAWSSYRRCFSMPQPQPDKIDEVFRKCR